MYFKQVDINGFGKLQNKKLDFVNGLNVVKGNNESGKSSLTNFIKGVFYGINKNKDGKKFSDYERFKPWDNTVFSGTLSYQYKDDEFTVFRDFTNNSGKVYDKSGSDITSTFNKDKSRGVEVGLKHFKIDEQTYENTLFISQSSIEVDDGEQSSVIQKLTNMIELGEECASYEKIKSKLEKMIVDEVGTSRTQNKPINVINREIMNYSKIRDELIYNRERLIEIDQNIREIKNKQEKINKSYEETKNVFDIRKKYESLLEEKRNAHEAEKKVLAKEKAEYEKTKKKKIIEGITSIIILFIIIICVLITFKKYTYIIACVGLAACFTWLYYEFEKKDNKTFDEPNFDIVSEELNKKEQKELQVLHENGIKESLLERKSQALKELLDGYEKTQKDLILEEHKLNIERDSLEKNVLKLKDTEECLQDAKNKKEEIIKLENAINIAITALEESYEEIKEKIIPDITQKIKEYVAIATNEEYTDVIYNDVQGILVKNTNGELITIDKLSMGTIDQIYLGFRLAIASKLDNLPLILDESFVYFDTERLENILKILSNVAKEKQIIILTCSNREIDLINKYNMAVNIQEL